MFKLSISNIGWEQKDDISIYNLMKKYCYSGLEIAPTRIIPENPYKKLEEAGKWQKELSSGYNFCVSSMQSIWYGRSERIFGSNKEWQALMDYTKEAILFAEVIGCENIVFGCPKNRSIPDDGDVETAVQFFKELGDFAFLHHTVIAMEANPRIYNTNFLNTTKETIEFVEHVGSAGFLLNLDTGTMIENGESISVLHGKEHIIHHVHISEPGLKPVQRHNLHKELAVMLRNMHYNNYVSIETGKQDDIQELSGMMRYVAQIFS